MLMKLKVTADEYDDRWRYQTTWMMVMVVVMMMLASLMAGCVSIG